MKFFKDKSESSAGEMGIQSPPYVHHGHTRISMPLAISPNICALNGTAKKVDIMEAISNQTTDRFKKMSGQ